ncbi:uncharacterized protein Z520_03657 [Fonsecaea multimorphosa CBS 102226]|uniref:Xylanolytic transcriptional activator regulatory domain-containing protein n=1 Tax=Fonsecaea multimorphosa CBS 102226 TaxID=1442371 RepID=A0A0D2HGH7_9EURO|nr:uncharacterized protein Z520_03657 [Fonsecaea multimorphosa CBS 102226]KIY00991.1 hypothetical protein Z520_03657 [Fonsecaea multimorphosa CBS 102226]
MASTPAAVARGGKSGTAVAILPQTRKELAFWNPRHRHLELPAGDRHEHGPAPILNPPGCAPVPQRSRVVKNGRGRYVYIGNSASLSFLSSIRRIVASAIGSYKFTQDVHLSAYSHQHQMIETVSMFKCSNGTNHPPDVDVQVAAELTTHFSLATTGILDLFEHHILQAQVRRFAHSPDRACWPHHAVLYLVLALGAQARAHGQGDDYLADSYFHFGLHQAMGELVDEPSIVTVQAFCLDTWYALAACRRTVATMYLGIATQADYTIGLHRPEANVVFGAERITSREKAWTGLRFCDVYVAALLGRPLATSNGHSNGTANSSSQKREERLGELRDSASPPLSDLCDTMYLRAHSIRGLHELLRHSSTSRIHCGTAAGMQPEAVQHA